MHRSCRDGGRRRVCDPHQAGVTRRGAPCAHVEFADRARNPRRRRGRLTADPALETLLLPFATARWRGRRRRRAVPACARRLAAASPARCRGWSASRLQARRRCAARAGLAVRRKPATTLTRVSAGAGAAAAPARRGARAVRARGRARRARRPRARLHAATTKARNPARPTWRASPVRCRRCRRTIAACSGPRRCTGTIDPALAAQWRAAGRAAADRRRPLHQPSRRVRLGPHRPGVGVARRAPAGRPRRPRRRPRRGLRLSRQRSARALPRASPRSTCTKPRRARSTLARSNLAPFASAGRARLPLARRHRRPAAALRLHRQQSAVPRAGPRRSPGHRPRFIAAAADALRPAGGCGWSPTATCRTKRCSTPRFGSVRTVAQRDGFKVIDGRSKRHAHGRTR